MPKPVPAIYIINGPNLNLLGKRQPEIYGHISFENYLDTLRTDFPKINLEYFQSNHEGEIIDKLQEIGFSDVGIILNPAAYTHTSIAIADAVAAIDAKVIEVHLSDIDQREAYRKTSYLRPFVRHHFQGHGLESYRMALEYLLKID